MLLVVLKLRLRVYWMGKHTLFPWGLGWLMKWLGGIPINRSASHNVVNETVRQYRENDELVVLIPPEGTRKKVERWKTGFYHIAHLAEVPILMGYVDAANKEAGSLIFPAHRRPGPGPGRDSWRCYATEKDCNPANGSQIGCATLNGGRWRSATADRQLRQPGSCPAAHRLPGRAASYQARTGHTLPCSHRAI